MVKTPYMDINGIRRGTWSKEEDERLKTYVNNHGYSNWRQLPKLAGLSRCGKSCRLRWMNYLRPDVKRGKLSKEEEDIIVKLHEALGNRWSVIAAHLPGRTDNEVKNQWHSFLKKRTMQQPVHHSKNVHAKKHKRSTVHCEKLKSSVLEVEESSVSIIEDFGGQGILESSDLSNSNLSRSSNELTSTYLNVTEIDPTMCMFADENYGFSGEMLNELSFEDLWTIPFFSTNTEHNSELDLEYFSQELLSSSLESEFCVSLW